MVTDCDIILAATYCSNMSDRAGDRKLKEQWLNLAAGCLAMTAAERPADAQSSEPAPDRRE